MFHSHPPTNKQRSWVKCRKGSFTSKPLEIDNNLDAFITHKLSTQTLTVTLTYPDKVFWSLIRHQTKPFTPDVLISPSAPAPYTPPQTPNPACYHTRSRGLAATSHVFARKKFLKESKKILLCEDVETRQPLESLRRSDMQTGVCLPTFCQLFSVNSK